MEPFSKRYKIDQAATSTSPHQPATQPNPLRKAHGYREPDQTDGLPQGWCSCPSMGEKTPLGSRHLSKIPGGFEFTPGILYEKAMARFGQRVGMVIDLTNTKRYYDARDWHELHVVYVKMPCRGRGQTPEPATVNYFMWEAMRFHEEHPDRLIVVHCTHGFNRTGFMIVNFIMRVGAGIKYEDNTLEAALSKFAGARKPGIYKNHYIETLYRYHHMRRPPALLTPRVPSWKGDNSPPGSPVRPILSAMRCNHSAHLSAFLPQGNEEVEPTDKPNEEWKHDDLLGEPIHEDMAHFLRTHVMNACRGTPQEHSRHIFPGSQPVSLDSQNLQLLQDRRYYVTWKADGTRYMLLLRADGTYLIDRKFTITRVEMRFPTKEAIPHHFTLLDGEMVVDEDLCSGVKTRRFLVYDLMMNQGQSFIHKPFKERFQAIHDELIKPRSMDKQQAVKKQTNYNYSLDLFSTRRKDFWQLHTAQKVLNQVIGNLTHESDGLIFQSWQDPYVSGTCNELLKWKFASHNSVDFLLQMDRSTGKPVLLLKGSNRGQRGNVPLQGGRIVFPDGDDPAEYDGKIVECRYLKDEDAWEFMRIRVDKDSGNAYHVYEKVLKSITDNITQEVLLDHIDNVVQHAEMYHAERADMEARGKRQQH